MIRLALGPACVIVQIAICGFVAFFAVLMAIGLAVLVTPIILGLFILYWAIEWLEKKGKIRF